MKGISGYLLFLVFLLMIGHVNLFAQEDAVRISGRVINTTTSESVPFAHIVNISRNRGTSAGADGNFSFLSIKNDTLQVTAIGYEDFIFTLKDSVAQGNYYLTIRLTPKAYLLEQVDIYADDPMKGFRRDTTRSTQYMVYPGRSDPTSRVLGAQPAGSGYITAFANLFNRYYQQEKKLEKLIEEENAEKMARSREEYIQDLRESRFGPAEIHRITSMTGTVLDNFIKNYQPSEPFLLQASDYEMTLYIINSYREYRLRNRMELTIDEILEYGKFKN